MKHLSGLILYVLFLCLTLQASVLCKVEDLKDSSKVFYLGEIVVMGTRESTSSPFQQNIIPQSEMENHHQLDASHALDFLSGLSLSNVGGRNESMVYVRGFDLRQVPVFIDGIPEYVPYDGYVDLARFTTLDLSEITITKGFSSVLYGPNAMGGAINLISRKPTGLYEYDLSIGAMNTGGYDYALNLGTNQGLYYVTGSASRLRQHSYPLSKSFVPTSTENGGERDNSYRQDIKYNIKAGLTPNETDEYSFTYINQQGEKGNPVYAGYNPGGTVRYWQWPDWDKFSEYFISQTLLGNKTSYDNVLIKTRFFHDKFKNTLFAYDDGTYAKQLKKSSFQSYYDDDTWGAVIEAKTDYLNKQHLTLAFHWKQDIHREHNLDEPVRTMQDAITSLGVEDVYRIFEQFSLIGGVSYDLRKELQAQDYNSKTGVISDFPMDDTHALNAQLGGIYDLSGTSQISFSIARKTRFATMKDRYSYKLDTAIPNPELIPEHAINYDVAYQEIIGTIGSYKVSTFYNDLGDVIQQVSNVQGNLSQMQNLGKARYYGGEVEIEAHPVAMLSASANYTLLERENISNPGVKFLDTPDHKIVVSTNVYPIPPLDITASMEYNSKRYSTSDGIYTAVPFAVYNIKTSINLFKQFVVDAGIQNLFDENYSLTEGYPEPGRTYYATLHIHN
jgi:iron complex outermembrane receptor protein